MRVMEALTRLVIGMSRFGDHLLRRKVSGIIVASLAFACGLGLAHALKSEPRPKCAAAVEVKAADPARAEVSVSDTSEGYPEAGDAIFEGLYVNHTYGYSVWIPPGMVGLGATPPAPQHGFGIDLDNPRSASWVQGPQFPKSYLYVDGSYNSLGWVRLYDAVESNLRFLREKGGDVHVQSQQGMTLGGLTALRVVATYEQDGEEMVSDEIVAFGEGGKPSVVYTVALSTPRSKYERDRRVLEGVWLSWYLQPTD